MTAIKRNFTALVFAVLIVCSGAASAQNHTPPLPGYLLVVGKTTDRAKIGAYAAALPPIYASHDAYYLSIGAGGRGVTWLEGPWQDRSIILAKFPSRAHIDAFWWGEAYRIALKKRDNAGVFSVAALEAATPLRFEGAGTGFLIVMTASRDRSPSQLALSQQAALALRQGVEQSGGHLLTSNEAGHYTSMEGDTVFDRFTVAAWSTKAARDAYLTSAAGRSTARLRRKLGLSAVASADGVPRTQAPPAATPQN